MKFQIALTGVFLMLAACGGSGTANFGGGGGGGGGDDAGGGDGSGVSDPGDLPIDVTNDTCAGAFVCSGDLLAVAYDPDAETLTLTNLPFDDDPLAGVYVRRADLDTGDFQVYENTTPSIFNRYLAVAGETAGGEITLGHTAIEGYQEFGYSGSWLQINNVENNLPGTGLVAYSGTYAGLMTFIGSGALYQTAGTVEMEVDFTDSKLKGFVENRVILDDPDTGADESQDLLNIVMNDTNIVDGSFEGTTASYDGAEQKGSGTYQGYFGGDGAPVIGGLLSITNPDFAGAGTEDDETDDLTSRDTGIFEAQCAGSITGC